MTDTFCHLPAACLPACVVVCFVDGDAVRIHLFAVVHFAAMLLPTFYRYPVTVLPCCCCCSLFLFDFAPYLTYRHHRLYTYPVVVVVLFCQTFCCLMHFAFGVVCCCWCCCWWQNGVSGIVLPPPSASRFCCCCCCCSALLRHLARLCRCYYIATCHISAHTPTCLPLFCCTYLPPPYRRSACHPHPTLFWCCIPVFTPHIFIVLCDIDDIDDRWWWWWLIFMTSWWLNDIFKLNYF